MRMEARAKIMVDEALPRNKKKLPLAEAFAMSLNTVDTENLQVESIMYLYELSEPLSQRVRE